MVTRRLVPPTGGGQSLLQEVATNLVGSRFFLLVSSVSIEDNSFEVQGRFPVSVIFIPEHFSADPAATLNKATGHQLVTFWWPISVDARVHDQRVSFSTSSLYIWLFTRLDIVLSRRS